MINTGDVIRLGRVCYIVKENSIELSEKAVRFLEEYAQKKNDTEWGKIIKQSTTSEIMQEQEKQNKSSPQKSSILVGESPYKSEFSKGSRFGDAVEDYFNNQLRQKSQDTITEAAEGNRFVNRRSSID